MASRIPLVYLADIIFEAGDESKIRELQSFYMPKCFFAPVQHARKIKSKVFACQN